MTVAGSMKRTVTRDAAYAQGAREARQLVEDQMSASLLLVVGASGAGKTAAVEELASRTLPNVECFHFDSVAVPNEAEMIKGWGSGESWQESETHRWIARLMERASRSSVRVLEGQTRPSFINAGLARVGSPTSEVVLLDCAPAVRAERLAARGQPHLATQRMDSWAAYLRGQADALGLHVINTDEKSVVNVADELQIQVQGLLARLERA